MIARLYSRAIFYLKIVYLQIKDGSWGSFANLMGDAFDLAGEKLAKYIRKAIKEGYVAE